MDLICKCIILMHKNAYHTMNSLTNSTWMHVSYMITFSYFIHKIKLKRCSSKVNLIVSLIKIGVPHVKLAWVMIVGITRYIKVLQIQPNQNWPHSYTLLMWFTLWPTHPNTNIQIYWLMRPLLHLICVEQVPRVGSNIQKTW